MSFTMIKALLTTATVLLYTQCTAQSAMPATYESLVKAEMPKVVTWRRDFHEHPELGNREFNTSKKVADHLRSLGLQVKTGIAKTGVTGILKGDKPGPVILLRADMDGLPLTENVKIPFASKVTTEYNGKTVGVMHACGHDSHMAILMGAAEVLTKMKKDVPGTIIFLFQPAEEGAPDGETGGAELMVKEGVMDDPKVDVAFGLHINSALEAGEIAYKPAGFMAACDWLTIKVKGKGAHGASPWRGVDPIVVSAEIINSLQTIVSRQEDLTNVPAVVTIGTINGGVRKNIVPDECVMTGTIRTLDTAMQRDIHMRVKRTAEMIAASAGATAEVSIEEVCPIVYNTPELVAKMLPSLRAAAGKDHVAEKGVSMGAEDFSFYGLKVPSFYFNIGGMPKGMDKNKASNHHTVDFYIDESGFDVGVKAFCQIVFDYGKTKK
jgi:amidohydrolase